MEEERQHITEEEQFLVILDSRNSVIKFNSSKNSYMKFDFQEPIIIEHNPLKISCSLTQFQAPNTLYIINDTNNFISITKNGTTSDITLTNGNYNAPQFRSLFIQNFGSSYTMTLNIYNNKWTITNTSHDFTINSTTTAYVFLGMAKNTAYSSSSFSLTLPFSCNFNGLQNFNVYLTNIGTSNIDSYNESRGSIIQSIPLDPSLPIINFVQQFDYNFTIYETTIDYLEISIMDDLENLLDFNNGEWNMTLCFKILRNKERFSMVKTFNHIVKQGGLF
jgi:hypothetical protein